MSQEARFTEQDLRDAHKDGYRIGVRHGMSQGLKAGQQLAGMSIYSPKRKTLVKPRYAYHRTFWDLSELRIKLGLK